VLAVFTVPLVLGAVYAAVSLRTTTFRRRVQLAEHRELVAGWAPAVTPSVDVFLPSCGESIELLRNTYEHVARLRWPADLRVLVLDDSARPEVARLARRYGFSYLTRPDRGHLKKAGNLKFGFERSAGDLVLILDADFCPAADLLHELVPYFDDAGVGIVQSPQYFDSRSPVTWLERGAGSVQEIFYRWVQPSRDGVGGAICVGTNALYRRSALDAAGGFAQIGHSEDVHTGVALLKRGFGLRYVPVLVARGLCPDNVAGFVSQQYRWCAGSMSLLADRGFHNADLPLRLRLCFWTGFLYYIATGVTVFTGPASALALLWLLPAQISPTRYLPLVTLSWTMFWLWNRVTLARWDLSVVRVQL
jgi:cellulose synthase (UDP-forming)